MSERRRKFGRFFEQNSRLPEKLFIRRQNIKEFDSDDDDDLEVIVIDGKAAEDHFCFVLRAISLKVSKFLLLLESGSSLLLTIHSHSL